MQNPVLEKSNIKVGLPLFSRGHLPFYTNAVVTKIDHENEKATVMTDYGNVMSFSYHSLNYHYTTAQQYLDGLEPEPIIQRLQIQIRNLNEQLELHLNSDSQ